MEKTVTTNLVEFDAHKVRKYLDRSINGFINDPPDSVYQKGFLAAVLIIWGEALGIKDARTEKLETYLEH